MTLKEKQTLLEACQWFNAKHVDKDKWPVDEQAIRRGKHALDLGASRLKERKERHDAFLDIVLSNLYFERMNILRNNKAFDLKAFNRVSRRSRYVQALKDNKELPNMN